MMSLEYTKQRISHLGSGFTSRQIYIDGGFSVEQVTLFTPQESEKGEVENGNSKEFGKQDQRAAS